MAGTVSCAFDPEAVRLTTGSRPAEGEQRVFRPGASLVWPQVPRLWCGQRFVVTPRSARYDRVGKPVVEPSAYDAAAREWCEWPGRLRETVKVTDLVTLRSRLAGSGWDEALSYCDIAPADREGLAGCHEAVLADDSYLADAGRYVAQLRRDTGRFGTSSERLELSEEDWSTRFDPLDTTVPPAVHYFFIFVMLAAVPDVLEYHRSLGIPDTTSRATLADVGRHLRVFRKALGYGSLTDQDWFQLHFTGMLYDFGRLQFNRGRFDIGATTAADSNTGPAPFCLHTHIPEKGPLTPESVGESFRAASAFYAHYFPDEPYSMATCSSWLLDAQLSQILPADSNIVRFARLFHLVDGADAGDGDGDVRNFVFRRQTVPIDELPQQTNLERGIVALWRAGGHFAVRTGWVPMADGARAY